MTGSRLPEKLVDSLGFLWILVDSRGLLEGIPFYIIALEHLQLEANLHYQGRLRKRSRFG